MRALWRVNWGVEVERLWWCVRQAFPELVMVRDREVEEGYGLVVVESGEDVLEARASNPGALVVTVAPGVSDGQLQGLLQAGSSTVWDPHVPDGIPGLLERLARLLRSAACGCCAGY